MKKLNIKKENKDFLEFDNGLFYIVESGYLTFNRSIAEESIDSTDKKQPYREIIPQLELPLTHRCNLNCIYCSFRERMKERTDLDMPWENIERAILYFKEYLEKSNIHYARIDFGVTGEPFLRKDIFEKVFSYIETVFENSKVKKIWSGPYISNATYPVINETIKDFCSSQDVSCDGPKDIHDNMRTYPNGKGSFDDFIKSLEIIGDTKPKFGVSAVLTSKNPDFSRIFNYLHTDLNFKSIYMKPANLKHNIDFSLNEENIEIFKSSYTKLIDDILAQEPEDILNSLLAFSKEDFFMRFFYRIKNRSKQYYRCGCGKSGIYVDSDGEFYPCAHFIGMKEYSMGNLTTGLNEEKIKIYSELHVNNRESCQACWARYLCGGGCLYQSVLANKSITEPDQSKCKLIKHLIVEAIRLYYYLYTKYPDILYAIPSTYFLSPDEINDDVFSRYIPQSRLQLTEEEKLLPLISNKTLKETLNSVSQIYFKFKKNNSKIIFIFNSKEIHSFDIDFSFYNLDKYEFIKEDLYNINSYELNSQFRINKNMKAFKLNIKDKKVEHIPYSDPEWTPYNEIDIKSKGDSLEISFDLEKIYASSPQRMGINFTCKFPKGHVSLITNEPFCLLNLDGNGYYYLNAPNFNDSIILDDISLDKTSMLPIDRWRGMKANVC